MQNDDDLLKFYLQANGPEAGSWNLSPKSLYIEYKTRSFLEKHFKLFKGIEVCNVGIGAGYWDNYLCFLASGIGKVTSIDIDKKTCELLAYRQRREGNPNPAKVICTSVHDTSNYASHFNIVTLIGSTVQESREYDLTLRSCCRLLQNGGNLLYMDFERYHIKEQLDGFIEREGQAIQAFERCDGIPGMAFYCARIYVL